MTPVMLPVVYLLEVLSLRTDTTIACRCQIVKLTGVEPNKNVFGFCSECVIIFFLDPC